MPTVNTAKIHPGEGGARTLRFEKLDEIEAEMGRIARAERAGSLEQLGNWSAGRIFNHLAAWIDYSYDGFPPELKPPWIIRFILKFQKGKFLRGPMPRGVKIPGVENGTFGTEPASLDEGEKRLQRSLARLKREKPTQKSVIFGEMSHEEWIKLTLRHAELHMGFLRY